MSVRSFTQIMADHEARNSARLEPAPIPFVSELKADDRVREWLAFIEPATVSGAVPFPEPKFPNLFGSVWLPKD